MAQQLDVPKLYKLVVDDVINNVREAFLDEGVDEQVLQELKQLWESKVKQSKAVEETTDLVPTYNAYVQQRNVLQQPAIRQAAPAQLAQQRTTQVTTQPIPVYNPATGTIGLSQPAQAAAVALPSGLYQQQVQHAIIQGPDGTQYIVPAQAGLVPGLSIVTNTTTGATMLPQQLAHFTTAQASSQPQTSTQNVVQLDGPPDLSELDCKVKVKAQVDAKNRFQKRNLQGAHTAAQDPSSESLGQEQVDGAHSVSQLDGTNDSSSEEDFDNNDDDDDDDDDKDDNEENEDFNGEEEEPLNSDDDVSDEDPSDLFDTENVVVCQFDKINRIKNKWKFNLKDGIMNLNGKDYVFSKGNGEAEW